MPKNFVQVEVSLTVWAVQEGGNLGDQESTTKGGRGIRWAAFSLVASSFFHILLQTEDWGQACFRCCGGRAVGNGEGRKETDFFNERGKDL